MLLVAAAIVRNVFVAVAVILLVVRGANHYHRYTFFYQYLFFCRFPLLFALLLLALPWLMVGPLRSLLGNLAELGAAGVGLTAFMATYTAWVLLFVLTRTLEIAPHKTKLPYMREGYSCSGRGGTIALPTVSRRLRVLCHLARVIRKEDDHPVLRLVYAGLIGLPLIGLVIYASSLIDGAWQSDRSWLLLGVNVVSAVAGIAAAAGIRWVVYAREHRDGREQPDHWYATRAARPFVRASSFILERFFRLSVEDLPAEVRINQAQAVIFAVLAAAIYGAVGLLTLPALPDAVAGLVPPVVLILMLVWLYAFVYSLLAVALDSFRVPVLTAALAALAVLYLALETDYTYRLRTIEPAPPPAMTSAAAPSAAAPSAGAAAALTPGAALDAWRQGRGAEAGALVVVAASGGGITAAQWTAEVLTRLHRDLYPHFGQALALLSTTSGGSTGGMYYTDRFPDLLADSSAARYDTVRAVAAASSLNAAVHGLVYGDVWRFLPGAHALLPDRGSALESVWQRRLAHPDASILSWGDDARAGRRPVHVFNATMAETGGLMMISPLHHGGIAYDSFRRLYPHHDLGIATAARLSATFPFVSPQARPGRLEAGDEAAYHLADGGYFDNQGLIGALTFVDEGYRDAAVAARLPPRVLLIQIRAFENEPPTAEPRAGWKYAFFGPVVTVMNMRSAAQQTRGAMEEDLFDRLLAGHGVAVERAVFPAGRAHAPLSWHLTDANRDDIRCAWNDQQATFTAVRTHLGLPEADFPFRPVKDCPASAATSLAGR